MSVSYTHLCITVQFDQEFIDQYLQEISGDLEVNFSDFFKEKGKFYLPNVKDVYKRQIRMSEHELGTARANEGSKKPFQPGLGNTLNHFR